MRTRMQAFTLVELLVVIGIIAMLISILLPALNGVRFQAKEVKCSSNVRQMTAGLLMYGNENRGRFPWHVVLNLNCAQYTAYTGSSGYWDVLSRRYIADPMLTICPFYDGKDAAAASQYFGDPFYYHPNQGTWGWNRFAPEGAKTPATITTVYVFLPNIQLVDNSKVKPFTYVNPVFAPNETPWPVRLKDCSTSAPMITHTLIYSGSSSSGDNGHGAKAPQVSPGSSKPTSYLNLRTRSQPVSYGDGHVEVHRYDNIRYRGTLTGQNFGVQDVWY